MKLFRSITFRAAVTVTAIAALLYFVDWSVFPGILARANPWLLAVVAALATLNIWLSSMKWMVLSRIAAHRYKLGEFFRVYLIGSFLNNFFPSTFGGDGYRVVAFYSDNRTSRSEAAIPVLIDRVMGLVTLCGLGGLCLLLTVAQYPPPLIQRVSLIAGILLVASIAVLVTAGRLNSRLPAIPRSKLAGVLATAARYRRRPGVLLSALAIGITFHLLVFTSRYILFGAFGNEVDWVQIGMVTAASTLIATLPISLNGFGVLEASFAYLMTFNGVPYEESVAVILVNRAILMGISLGGGVLWALATRTREEQSEGGSH